MPPTVALAPVQPTDGDGRVSAALSHIGEAAQPTSCPDQGHLDDGHRVAARRRVVHGRALPIRGPSTISVVILAARMVSVLGKSHLSRIGDRGQVSGFWRHAACGRSQLFSARRAPAPAHSSARHRSAPRHQRQSGGQSGLGARIRIAQLAEGGASPTLWVRSGWIADLRRKPARVKLLRR